MTKRTRPRGRLARTVGSARHRWGTSVPADDEEARNRLLDAAEACFERYSVSRTTMDDVAREAHVHRTTVYRYFAGRDEILLSILLRETEVLIHQAAEALDTAGEFGEGLVQALLLSARTIRENPHLRRLYGAESGAEIARTAAASEELAERTRATLMPRLERAAARGELRPGLDLEEVPGWLRWLVNWILSDAEHIARGELERMLRTFVLPGLVANAPLPAPRPKRSVRRQPRRG